MRQVSPSPHGICPRLSALLCVDLPVDGEDDVLKDLLRERHRPDWKMENVNQDVIGGITYSLDGLPACLLVVVTIITVLGKLKAWDILYQIYNSC